MSTAGTLSAKALLSRANSMPVVSTSHNNGKDEVIMNDSKEVLLRMFEHLIAKEQTKSTGKSNGCRGRRDGKAGLKRANTGEVKTMTMAAAVRRGRQHQLANFANDEGIKRSSASSGRSSMSSD